MKLIRRLMFRLYPWRHYGLPRKVKGCVQWLRADDPRLCHAPYSKGGRVAIWPDLSGNEHDATCVGGPRVEPREGDAA